MRSISDKTRLLVANICYANVLGRFANFCNLQNRGAEFSWDHFVESCAKNSDMWLMLQNVPGYARPEIIELGRVYATEIAQTCMDRSGFVDKQTEE